MRRRDLPIVTLAGLLLAGCGLFGDDPPPPPPPPPPPTIVSLTLKATADVNPDATGAAKPIAVRIYQLASVADFMASDFFTLEGDPAALLGGDLLAQESLVLAPGGTEVYTRELKPEARFIGVTAAYAQIDGAGWRAFFEPPPNQTTLLLAQLGARGLALRPANP